MNNFIKAMVLFNLIACISIEIQAKTISYQDEKGDLVDTVVDLQSNDLFFLALYAEEEKDLERIQKNQRMWTRAHKICRFLKPEYLRASGFETVPYSNFDLFFLIGDNEDLNIVQASPVYEYNKKIEVTEKGHLFKSNEYGIKTYRSISFEPRRFENIKCSKGN